MSRHKARKNRKRSERNIPRSEGFEICFCLKVSERENRTKKEKKKGRESTDRGTQSRTGTYRKSGERQTDRKGKKKQQKKPQPCTLL